MKFRKWLSIMLAASVIVSFCGCKKKPNVTDTSETKESEETRKSGKTTEKTSASDETVPPSTPTAATHVKDESEDPLLIYGYVKDFEDLLEMYVSDVEYEYVYVDPSTYYQKLQEAFTSEDAQPDLFMVDADHVQEYSYSDMTLPMSELGISGSEIEDQFAYTYQVASDEDHVVKGLSYDPCPAAIIYNRALAQEYLGYSEPNDVAEFFMNWNEIIESARAVNINSEGKIKLFSALREISPVFWEAHDGNWIVDGQVQINELFDEYYMLEEILFSETLTFETESRSSQWKSDLNDGRSVMFFGSLATAAEVIGYVPGHDATIDAKDPTDPSESSDPSDPTDETEPVEVEVTGWGILPAPEPTYDGGDWLMAASTCDMRASAAEVLRALTMDKENLEQMALEGRFVNSRTIMKQCATDSFFASDFFNGQNPYAILVSEAEKIQVVPDTEVDLYARSEVENLLSAYLSGEIETMDEVKQQFIIGMQELFGLV